MPRSQKGRFLTRKEDLTPQEIEKCQAEWEMKMKK